jgi:hypothetical protein
MLATHRPHDDLEREHMVDGVLRQRAPPEFGERPD